MPEHCELIDFAASRLSKTKIEANLLAAVEEAEQIQAMLRRHLTQAHLCALSGFDAEPSLDAARTAVARLQGQLQFSEALAHRIARRRAAAA